MADAADLLPPPEASPAASACEEEHIEEASSATSDGGSPAPSPSPPPEERPRLTESQRSLLPKWLLDSQRSLDDFDARHEQARKSIADLKSSMVDFDHLVAKLSLDAKVTATEAPAALSESASVERGPQLLPVEVAAYCTSFLAGVELVVFSLCSRRAQQWLVGEDMWRASYERQALKGPGYRSAVLSQAALTFECMDFISSMCRGRDVAHRTYALSAEGRRKALPALEALVLVTATPTSEAHSRLGAVVPMLVAMLSNESGAIQEVAAAALANLICSPKTQKNVLKEMSGCNARKSLVPLLTSPQARVTLHVAPGSNNDTSFGCQGVACKHASRCLANTFLPEKSLALPPDNCRRLETATINVDDWPQVADWDFYSFYASGSFKDRSTLTLRFEEDKTLTGFGTDNIGAFVLNGRRNGSQISFVKNYGTTTASSAGHVSHVLYFASRKDGMWGVWEVTSSDAHFELRRGGCCRCVLSSEQQQSEPPQLEEIHHHQQPPPAPPRAP